MRTVKSVRVSSVMPSVRCLFLPFSCPSSPPPPRAVAINCRSSYHTFAASSRLSYPVVETYTFDCYLRRRREGGSSFFDLEGRNPNFTHDDEQAKIIQHRQEQGYLTYINDNNHQQTSYTWRIHQQPQHIIPPITLSSVIVSHSRRS